MIQFENTKSVAITLNAFGLASRSWNGKGSKVSFVDEGEVRLYANQLAPFLQDGTLVPCVEKAQEAPKAAPVAALVEPEVVAEPVVETEPETAEKTEIKKMKSRRSEG